MNSDEKAESMADLETQSPVLDEQKLVNKLKIAHRYDVSPRTVQDWMGEGKLPYHKIGYLVRFDPEECDRALERYKIPAKN
jgi:excisionase family DNA binding protein